MLWTVDLGCRAKRAGVGCNAAGRVFVGQSFAEDSEAKRVSPDVGIRTLRLGGRADDLRQSCGQFGLDLCRKGVPAASPQSATCNNRAGQPGKFS